MRLIAAILKPVADTDHLSIQQLRVRECYDIFTFKHHPILLKEIATKHPGQI